MTKIALIYGGLAGSVIIGVMVLGIAMSGGEPSAGSQTVGYLIMIVGLSMIFLGVKRYRDRELGGVIKFMPAFLLGLAIAGVAAIVYVAVWEAYLASTDYAFINEYTAGVIEAKRAAGLSGADLDRLIADMEAMKTNYGKAFYRLPITFLEIFPVGVIVSLLSAALLRNPKVFPAR